jgi:hypothetical protein
VVGGGGEVRLLNAGGSGRPPLARGADHFPALGGASSSAAPAAAAVPEASEEASSSGAEAGSSRPGSAEEGLVALQRDDWEDVLARPARRLPRSPSAQEISPPSPQLEEQFAEFRWGGAKGQSRVVVASSCPSCPSP